MFFRNGFASRSHVRDLLEVDVAVNKLSEIIKLNHFSLAAEISMEFDLMFVVKMFYNVILQIYFRSLSSAQARNMLNLYIDIAQLSISAKDPLRYL